MKTARLKEWTYEEFMSLPEDHSCRYEPAATRSSMETSA